MTSSIGDRITYLRKQARLTRIFIREKYSISENTLRKWEENKLKVPEDKIDLIFYVFNNEGVQVTKEWIKSGKGDKPLFSINYEKIKISSIKNDDVLALEEMQLLISTDKENLVYMLLENDTMFPYYQPISWIIGKKNNNLSSCIGKDCIIKVKNNNSFTFRRVGYSEKKDCFNLYILNTYDIKFSDPVYYDVEVEFIAPISWIRKIYEQK
ncbi:hypothetical protein GCL60_16830 (plasmid) [Silvanigrella paludirubra]|uniref:HTH cro/C1-type domain-containing protein n=1 Tax=Silvanigrella paludirubra TaxID=2499159 RepID=A0A6N6VTF5_9BACT|nr:helix-turn-helix domain-containing protein [Silvanigrella paludirubra]KAB8035612.1 hypothetical protein GCL60_16830 [Silvanigrella paludirubra]MBX9837477.1 helix-turn-helix domain-containing protein [Silvanigrellaceae bacterium]